jgi:hypothetical protein
MKPPKLHAKISDYASLLTVNSACSMFFEGPQVTGQTQVSIF